MALLDAFGNQIATPPTAAPATPPDSTEAAEAETAAEVHAVRQALRTTLTHLTMARQAGARHQQVNTVSFGAMVFVCACALDKFVEDRMLDENGVRELLPDSLSKHFDNGVGSLLASVVEEIKAVHEAAKTVQVVSASALDLLDAERALLAGG